MNYCPKCGCEVSENDEFCVSCGTSLVENKPLNNQTEEKTFLDDLPYVVLVIILLWLVLYILPLKMKVPWGDLFSDSQITCNKIAWEKLL